MNASSNGVLSRAKRALDSRSHSALNRRLGTDIAFDGQSPGTELLDGLDGLRRFRLRIAVGDDHIRAGAGQRQRDFAANAHGSACDQS